MSSGTLTQCLGLKPEPTRKFRIKKKKTTRKETIKPFFSPPQQKRQLVHACI